MNAKLIDQADLDLFIKRNVVIELVKKLDIPSEMIRTEPKPVFGYVFGNDFTSELDKRVKNVQRSQTLGEFIEELIHSKNYNISDFYFRAGIKKEYWHKITKGKIKNPSKAKLLCIAIALKLDLKETEMLLRKAGYSFTSDLTILESIIAYFIEKRIYSLFEIDAQLERYNQPTIYSIKD